MSGPTLDCPKQKTKGSKSGSAVGTKSGFIEFFGGSTEPSFHFDAPTNNPTTQDFSFNFDSGSGDAFGFEEGTTAFSEGFGGGQLNF